MVNRFEVNKMDEMEFIMMGNHPVENIFVERGTAYKEVADFIKMLHQQAINDDQTSISKQSDWLMCQYILLQKMAVLLRTEMERLE